MEEREKAPKETEQEPEVEAHKFHKASDAAASDPAAAAAAETREKRPRESDDEPDVEAHKFHR